MWETFQANKYINSAQSAHRAEGNIGQGYEYSPANSLHITMNLKTEGVYLQRGQLSKCIMLDWCEAQQYH